MTRLFFTLVLLLCTACGADEPSGSSSREAPSPSDASAPSTPTKAEAPVQPMEAAPHRLVVTDPMDLRAYPDLSELVELDLALSIADSRERPLPPGESPPEFDRCAGLDFDWLAQRAPSLSKLRVSGCPSAIHGGFAGLAPRLTSLELADITLDDLSVQRIVELPALVSLGLSRVRAGAEAPAELGRSRRITKLQLRELEPDSVIGDLLGDMRNLQEVTLEGPWAGHRAMLSLNRAKKLERLDLLETSVTNYSLNQIKFLYKLREVHWTGTAFNDASPLYLRNLPVEIWECGCPSFGDRGLKHLRYLPQLRVLSLDRTRISSGGLTELSRLVHLERVAIRDRDLDGAAFEAFAKLPELRDLTLEGGALLDPKATHLGELIGLESLHMGLSGFGDEAAAELETLVALQALDLGGSQLSDDGLAPLSKLIALRRLALHHTRVTNRGLEHLAPLSRLEVLELDHTDVVDAGVQHLAALKNLRDLRLDHTLVTDAAIDPLLTMPRLRRLNLEGTVVTDAGARRLSELQSLEVVNLRGTRTTGP